MDRFVESWYEWLAFVFHILLCLSPLGIATALSILFSPWTFHGSWYSFYIRLLSKLVKEKS